MKEADFELADVEAIARHWVEHGRTDSFGKPNPGDWDHIKAHKPIAYSEAIRVATWALSIPTPATRVSNKL